MFSCVSLWKPKMSTRVALVSFVEDSCCSCLTRAVCVAQVSLVSDTRVVNETRSLDCTVEWRFCNCVSKTKQWKLLFLTSEIQKLSKKIFLISLLVNLITHKIWIKGAVILIFKDSFYWNRSHHFFWVTHEYLKYKPYLKTGRSNFV